LRLNIRRSIILLRNKREPWRLTRSYFDEASTGNTVMRIFMLSLTPL